LDEFFFKIVVDRFVWSGRSGNGQNPVLHASFPFVDVWAIHIGEGVCDFLPWVHHDRMRGIHELVKTKFVEEMVGLLSVSVEDRGFFSLEGFFVSLDWVRWLW
jgi:hypothetical protein